MIRKFATVFLLFFALLSMAEELAIPDVLKTVPSYHKANITTNGLLWVATVPNFGIDYQLTERLSAGGSIMWCPWFVSDSRAIRVLGTQPSFRWWFKSYGSGSYLSPHISIAWYNLKYGSYRYQDNSRPALGFGISYGYVAKLKGKLSLEFSGGAGFLSLRYDRFYNTENGRLVDTRQTYYFGIDHLGISLVYNFKDR